MATTDEDQKDAQRAAAAGDPVGMLAALARSGFLENLEAQIGRQFHRLDDDHARYVVGAAVDSVYVRVQAGQRIGNIFPYLYRAAQNIAKDLSARCPERVVSFDERLDGALDEPAPIGDEERERALAQEDALRRAQIREVRRLIPRIPQTRPQQVMGIIFDALDQGVHGLTHEEIADMLGITKGYVATAKHRGFEYLTDLLKEEGLLPLDFTLREIRLADEAEALAAAEAEGLT